MIAKFIDLSRSSGKLFLGIVLLFVGGLEISSQGLAQDPLLSSSSSPSPSSSDFELTPEMVRQSIDGAISYLRQRQQKDGSWNEYPGYEPGTTSLCTLALLTAGLDKDDPTVAKALAYLEKFTPDMQNQTYPISLQTMVFCTANPREYLPLIQRNADWLISRQFRTENVFNGGWGYFGSHQEYDRVDNSNSQFAVLALYESELAGAEIDPALWDTTLDYWLRMQNEDGSWGYRASGLDLQSGNSGVGSGSMTCAGVTALVICSGIRGKGGARVEGQEIQCCQDVDDTISQRLQQALGWLADHFSVRTNPGTIADSDQYVFYYLYGLERAGRLTANRFIGTNDWYREGTEYLLRRKGLLSQFWNAANDFKKNHSVTTAFALLFLSKGRLPVLISKYRFASSDETESWNAHPNDVAHLTQYAEKNWNMRLIWQVIDASRASADDLAQTPILYLSGTQSPIPSDADQKRTMILALRGYLEQGGFILAEALDGDLSFETGFFDLMNEVLPENGNQFHLLDAEHPLWYAEKAVAADFQRPLYGIDYGCRTSVVFVPAYKPTANAAPPSVFEDRPSLSCLWELAQPTIRKTQYPADVQDQVTAALDIGLNILSYATNRDLKFKEDVPESASEEWEKDADKHGNIFAALLDHGGGSACAPRAIPNLMRIIQTQLGIPVQTYVKRIKASSDELFNAPILFMHGRNSFHFSDSERANLRLYFERGGFLFANSICASEAFSQAFEEEMKAIFPESALQAIPLDDPVFSNQYGGYAIEKLEIRKARRQTDQKYQSETVESPPELKGILQDGRWVVIFSPYDISCALEKAASIECVGYSQKSAFQLAVNVLLYTIEHL